MARKAPQAAEDVLGKPGEAVHADGVGAFLSRKAQHGLFRLEGELLGDQHYTFLVALKGAAGKGLPQVFGFPTSGAAKYELEHGAS